MHPALQPLAERILAYLGMRWGMPVVAAHARADSGRRVARDLSRCASRPAARFAD